MPRYANTQQSKADAWAIAAGVLAAITGLSIFPTVESGAGIDLAAVIVAIGAFLASAFALVPRIKNYGEMAGKAREIASKYGPLEGALMDALEEADAGKGTDASRREVVNAFEAAKSKKDELRYLKPRKKTAP